MTDLSDVDMEGVKPMTDAQELPIGQYLVRIEDTEKTATKEKYDEEGNKMPPNHYLLVAMKVYGGPNEGQVENARLNLWNSNPDAVRMAKSELKSIQEATGVVSTNSDHLHNKWMLLEIRMGKTEKTKDKMYKHYSAVPPNILSQFTHIPPVPAKTPKPAAAAPVAHVAQAGAAAPAAAAAPVAHVAQAGAAAPAAAASADIPDWAKKK